MGVKRVFKNRVGQKFGRLVVVSLYEKRKLINKTATRVYWKCVCDCGNTKIIRADALSMGKAKSCGCLQKEIVREIGKKRKIHGFCVEGRKDIFYKKWSGILRRCNNKNDVGYKNYGGRGIRCLWGSFEEFREDMYEPYKKHSKKYGFKNTTIERIDVNGHYSKENCHWATIKEQAHNKRNTTYLSIGLEKKSIVEWSEISGIKPSTIKARIKRGWSSEESVKTPLNVYLAWKR